MDADRSEKPRDGGSQRAYTPAELANMTPWQAPRKVSGAGVNRRRQPSSQSGSVSAAIVFWIVCWGLAGISAWILSSLNYDEGGWWAIPIILFCVGGLPLADYLE